MIRPAKYEYARNEMKSRLFAIGDIHGCFHSFKKLVEDKIQLQKRDNLVLLGDYIDRGNESKEVVDFIIELEEQGYSIIPLMGNHEAMFLEAYSDESNNQIWIQNGGAATLKSFGVQSIKSIDPKYIRFFKALKSHYPFGDFLFVHAGFNDRLLNPFIDEYSMLWKCETSFENPLLINKTIVHGHCPVKVSDHDNRILKQPWVINIDTGCVYKDKEGYGKLSAYECYGQELYFV